MHPVLRKAIRAAADRDTGLAFVPALKTGVPTVTTKDWLCEAYAAGEVELRPEGGMHRLTNEERYRCPVGPKGAPLAWVRILRKIKG